ncbi:LPXTG cell wall anchor domain-containing protein [Yinghuangia seranimata]|uniref:LPXTG cell wall anchor domain-containing protein n=1 Tax=Yinghuangia seranimata TaxID=408067 RepID=UPI00248CE1E7|nr:LPXTG cell wall anchor domain-containing protein [Yinghuangia seranimata]MDI2131926.1 LPXTG cell wall anchor domain-containing protein [Yinghuangia seranimata]
MSKRVRAVAASFVLTVLTVPVAVGAVAAPDPVPPVGQGPATAPMVEPRAGLPGLRPDPNAHPSSAPAREREAPGRADRPSDAELAALLAAVAPLGIRPVTDVTGVPALTVDHELVLAGGLEGLDALRAAGMQIAPGPRAGVSAVHSGTRIIAWYLVDQPAPGAASGSPAPGSPAPSAAPSSVPSRTPVAELPHTGASGTVPVVLVGLVLVAAGGLVVAAVAGRGRARG